MFGYVRPLTPELRVRELERFRALYCGVCRSLGKRYGFAARFVLSYDFVFLAALLWDAEDAPDIGMCRCPLSFRKKRCVGACGATDRAAGLGVILAYRKLRDNVSDEGFLKSAGSRLASLLLRRAYKKAAREFPGFDAAALARLAELEVLEAGTGVPLDALADAFAGLLSDIAQPEAEQARRRVLENLLYHLGRWLYLIDARDDRDEDARRGRPNALTGRVADDKALQTTLTHSNNLAISAFELLPETAWSDILRNILCLGLPDAQARVFAGEWESTRGYYKI